MTLRRALLTLLALVPLYLFWTFDHSLWNPDETRDAGIAREMFDEKDFVVPKLNGEPFLEKPPLYYWSCAAVYKATGHVTAGLTRLPAVLYGLLGALFTFLIGRRLLSVRAGVMGAVFLATAVQWFKTSHFALMDSSLAALITGALYFYLAEAHLLFILFTVLAFFSKGFVAVAMVGVVVTADLAVSRRYGKFAALVVGGAVLFAVCVAPWVYGLWRAGGAEHMRVFFVENNFNRFVSDQADHAQPPYYYLGSFLGDFMPWSVLFLGALVALFRKEERTAQAPAARFLWTWFFSMFFFLSVSQSKRSMYLLPAFPAAALMVAAWLDRRMDEGLADRGLRIAAGVTTVVLVVLGIGICGAALVVTKTYVAGVLGAVVVTALSVYAFGRFQERRPWPLFLAWFALAGFAYVGGNRVFIGRMEADKTFVPFVDRVKAERGEGELVAFRLSEMERGVFYFYFGQRIPEFRGEARLNDYLARNRDRKILVIVPRNGLERLDLEPPVSTRVVATYRPDKKARSFLLFSNRPAAVSPSEP